MIVIRIDAMSAVPNPSTINPGVRPAASNNKIALITSENKPNVRKVIGNVNKVKIGLRNALTRLMMSAATSAVVKFSS